MAHPPLTRRQRDIVDFLEQYVAEHGLSPTLEEIAVHFGVNKVTIFGHVAELERKGVVRRAAKGVSRSLQLVQGAGGEGADSDLHGAGVSSTSDDPNQGRSLAGTTSPRGGPAVDVLGTIAAGAPIETIEAPESLDFGASMVSMGAPAAIVPSTSTAGPPRGEVVPARERP